jgi:hypothetical protein
MKPAYTSLYNSERAQVIKDYPCFEGYFDDLEARILKNPLASAEEVVLFQGKPVHARKRAIKTTFFSGLLRDEYLYLTLTYALTIDNKVVILFLRLRNVIV